MEEDFRACYRFIRDDIRLCAVVNRTDGKQTLVMEKLDLANVKKNAPKVEFTDSLECIHTAVLDLQPEQLEDAVQDPEFGKKTLKIRSSEDLMEFELAPEEKFKAFRSWVAGIAEAGLDAFRIQSEIEGEGKLIYPIAHPLMRFLAKIDTKIMFDYIEMIERTCVHEGIQHKSSVIANLDPILEILVQNEDMDNADKILKAIFQIDPPIQLFTKDVNKIEFLRHPDAINMTEFPQILSEPSFVREKVLENPNITVSDIFPNFLSVKTETDPFVRQKAAALEKAPDSSDYVKFLSAKTEPDYRVRKAAARNENSLKFKADIVNFFDFKTEPHPSVRKIIAGREDCVNFKEYNNFLSYETEPDPHVRKEAARNDKAVKLRSYKSFMSAKTEPNFEVRAITARSKLAAEYNKFKDLISEKIESSEYVRNLAEETLKDADDRVKPISREDYDLFDRYRTELAELTEEFYNDISELRKRIKTLKDRLFPPEVQLEEDVSRELERLKRMAVKRRHKLPEKRF